MSIVFKIHARDSARDAARNRVDVAIDLSIIGRLVRIQIAVQEKASHG